MWSWEHLWHWSRILRLCHFWKTKQIQKLKVSLLLQFRWLEKCNKTRHTSYVEHKLTVTQMLPECQPDPLGKTPVQLHAPKRASVQAVQIPSLSFYLHSRKEISSNSHHRQNGEKCTKNWTEHVRACGTFKSPRFTISEKIKLEDWELELEKAFLNRASMQQDERLILKTMAFNISSNKHSPSCFSKTVWLSFFFGA